MIYFFSPYSLEKNIGKAYNDYCKLVPHDEDWICLTDIDSMLLGTEVGQQLETIIHQNPDIGLFSCLTNRIGTSSQLLAGYWNEKDLTVHRTISLERQQQQYADITIIHERISGVLMLFSKATWRLVGGFKEQEMLGIDYDFSQRVLDAKKSIAIMNGVYSTHYYRLNEGSHHTAHLGIPNQNKFIFSIKRFLYRIKQRIIFDNGIQVKRHKDCE